MALSKLGELLERFNMPISSQAVRSANSITEGSETRGMNSTSNNFPHECPATDKVEDIVRH